MQIQDSIPVKKATLGMGEYGCWECTLTPCNSDNPNDKTGNAACPEKLWVFARSLREITENLSTVESAVLLGKATCIADPLTPGITGEPQPDIMQVVVESAIPEPPVPKSSPSIPEVVCPYCGRAAPASEFKKPDGIANDLLACPHCRMLSPLNRLKAKP